MSALPTSSDAYTNPSNPISKDDAERAQAERKNPQSSSHIVASLGPDSRDPNAPAAPTSRGRGVEGSAPTNEAEAKDARHGAGTDVANDSVDGEQLATLAEGKVADAVERKAGTQKVTDGPVVFDDNAANIDQKKAEQAEAREEIKAARKAGVDVDGGSEHRRTGVEVD